MGDPKFETAGHDIFEDPGEIGFRYRVGRLELAPGDVLVVKVDQRLSPEVASRIRQYVANATPSGTKAMVIDASVDLSVLTRKEIEERFEVEENPKL